MKQHIGASLVGSWRFQYPRPHIKKLVGLWFCSDRATMAWLTAPSAETIPKVCGRISTGETPAIAYSKWADL